MPTLTAAEFPWNGVEWNGLVLSPALHQNKVFAANIATTVLFQKIGILYFNYI